MVHNFEQPNNSLRKNKRKIVEEEKKDDGKKKNCRWEREERRWKERPNLEYLKKKTNFLDFSFCYTGCKYFSGLLYL